ncbi:hypothetical protein IQ215_06995 [Cyanobacterium stanieri LEGE 03274]|uniref:Histidine kinase n=1 Tax=Cyanobacterium stanieri LEGE 03274 TaxID=1828756 RepID=A0ABR9V5M7_9CHRO|nr:hypothetical protein [Cyanobacterium stanieri]MBE9222441.1 hypothetical protein [Cyanobacterium stanieri LEGE 03274]
MDSTTIKEKVKAIASKREMLVKLSEKPDLGNLKLDVTQALDELDELIEELHLTFPETAKN